MKRIILAAKSIRLSPQSRDVVMSTIISNYLARQFSVFRESFSLFIELINYLFDEKIFLSHTNFVKQKPAMIDSDLIT